MLRSQVNRFIDDAIKMMQEYRFQLPGFAFWNVQDWKKKKASCQEIFTNQLGWDITDFGRGDYSKEGLMLFTLRNGQPANWETKTGKLYAEKIMIAKINQVTPMHFHWSKMEDIINRNGGKLVMDVYKASEMEDLSAESFDLSIDGTVIHCKAGDRLVLEPGQSVTFPPEIYHSFWAEESPVLIGEVSLVNDDHHDNRFLEETGRFPEIEEDEEPRYLLVGDYEKFL